MSFDARGSSRGFGYRLGTTNWSVATPFATPTMTAAAFLATHTTVDTTLPVSDECPICLDNYANEACLLITGIPGCTHHIGQNCLKEILSSQPRTEKKCPLCRTTWIAAPAARPRAQRPLQGVPMTSGISPSFQEWQAIISQADRDQDRATWDSLARSVSDEAMRTGAPTFRLPPTPRIPTAQAFQSPHQLISTDNDSEPEDYATLTRDIESVRARARNTQLPRGQRRQTLHTSQPQASRDTRANAVTLEEDEEVRRSSLFTNPFRQNVPFRGTTRPTSNSTRHRPTVAVPRLPPPPRSSSLQQQAKPREIITRGPNSYRPPHLEVEIPPTSPRPSASFNSLDAVDSDITISTNATPDAFQTPAIGSTAVSNNDQHDQRENELNSRQIALNGRQNALDQRELDLNVREAKLNQRAANLEAREETTPVQRQDSAPAGEIHKASLLRILQKQQDEREAMAEKQKEEIKNIVRDAERTINRPS